MNLQRKGGKPGQRKKSGLGVLLQWLPGFEVRSSKFAKMRRSREGWRYNAWSQLFGWKPMEKKRQQLAEVKEEGGGLH